MVTYDKLKWHSDHESFPKGMEENRGGVYGAIFFCWALSRGFLNDDFQNELSQEIDLFKSKKMSPLDLYAVIGAIDSEIFTEEGCHFAFHCFESENFDFYGWFEGFYCQGLSSPYEFNITHSEIEEILQNIDYLYDNFKSNTEP